MHACVRSVCGLSDVFIRDRCVLCVDVGARPHQQVARAWALDWWCSSWGPVFIVGLKSFSDVLLSSSTIITVDLNCKSDWLVTLESVLQLLSFQHVNHG